MEQIKENKHRPVKVNGYSNAKSRVKANKRQKEADLRQGKYDFLTKAEKLILIKSRRGNSKKEFDRINKLK